MRPRTWMTRHWSIWSTLSYSEIFDEFDKYEVTGGIKGAAFKAVKKAAAILKNLRKLQNRIYDLFMALAEASIGADYEPNPSSFSEGELKGLFNPDVPDDDDSRDSILVPLILDISDTFPLPDHDMTPCPSELTKETTAGPNSVANGPAARVVASIAIVGLTVWICGIYQDLFHALRIRLFLSCQLNPKRRLTSSRGCWRPTFPRVPGKFKGLIGTSGLGKSKTSSLRSVGPPLPINPQRCL